MSAPSDDFIRRATVIEVIDGDTIRLSIDLGFAAAIVHDVRLAGVNAPESRGPERAAGLYVAKIVAAMVSAGDVVLIHSKVFSLGKYGRCICDLWLPKVGKNLNAFLIEQRLAWQTDDSGSLTQSRTVDSLHGIPEAIKQQIREALA